MAPVAAAGYVLIAALAVTAVMAGAVGGALAWAVRGRLLLYGLLTVAGYLAVTVLFDSYSIKGAVAFIPLVVLPFLACWVIARALEARARWRHAWATLVALGGALLLGFLCLLLSRIYFVWGPVLAALAADACLILYIYRTRRVVAP